MATSKAYNPYDDLNSIVEYKTSYMDAQKNGGNYNAYGQAAQAHYNNLRANGYEELADAMTMSDVKTATGILNKYKATPSAYDNANSMSDLMNKYGSPSAAATAFNERSTSNLQALFDLTGQNNANITARGNDLWGQMSQFGVQQAARYDDLYGYIKNTNYMDSPEGKSIMSYYNGLGGQASKSATATAAGSNAGNIDSYSAANANRQQLAYTNAGTQAVLNQKNSNVGNMLATLQSLGVDVGDLQNRMLGMYQGDQTYNLGLMGEYTTGQNNIANQLQNQDNARIGLIGSGLDYLKTIDTNETNLEGIRDTNAAGTAQTNSTNQANITVAQLQEQTKLAIQEMQGKSAVEQLQIGGKNAVELQNAVNEGIMSQNLANIEIQRLASAASTSVAAINKAASDYAADSNVKIAETTAAAKTDESAETDAFDLQSPEKKYQDLVSAYRYYKSQGKSDTETMHILKQMFKNYNEMIEDISTDFRNGDLK